MRTFHSLALVTTLIMVVVAVSPGRMVGARATYQGSIRIDASICPAGAVQLTSECSQGRGPIGVMIAIDGELPRATDAAGAVTFDALVAGDHVVTVKTSPYAERFGQMRVFCSNSIAAIDPSPVTLGAGDEAGFLVKVAPRSEVTCNLSFIP